MADEAQPITKDVQPSPIEESPFTNHHSCLRRGCSWTFGCLFILIAAGFLIFWSFASPSPQRTASLPANFPTDIPFYKFEDRATIAYLSGQARDTKLNRALLIAKHFLNPLNKIIEQATPAEIKNSQGPLAISRKKFFQDVKKVWETPVADYNMETLTITWENLDDEMDAIYRSYQKDLRDRGYKLAPGIKTPAQMSLEFKKEITNGRLTVKKTSDNKGVNVTLEISYSNQK